MGQVLRELAAKVRLSKLRKHRRGPKRPQPKRASGAKVSHVSTARLLAERKKRSKIHLQGYGRERLPRQEHRREGVDVTPPRRLTRPIEPSKFPQDTTSRKIP